MQQACFKSAVQKDFSRRKLPAGPVSPDSFCPSTLAAPNDGKLLTTHQQEKTNSLNTYLKFPLVFSEGFYWVIKLIIEVKHFTDVLHF